MFNFQQKFLQIFGFFFRSSFGNVDLREKQLQTKLQTSESKLCNNSSPFKLLMNMNVSYQMRSLYKWDLNIASKFRSDFNDAT